jgi:hypothetical protein
VTSDVKFKGVVSRHGAGWLEHEFGGSGDDRMATEPLIARERCLYWGGAITGLGAGTILGYGLHSDGYISGKGIHIFILASSGLAMILGHVIAGLRRRMKEID